MTRRKPLLFFALILFTFSYFYQGGGFNQNSTVGEIRQLVEHGTVNITNWRPVTGDVSEYRGQVYSNKSPSMLFVAAPAYYVFFGAAKALRIDPSGAAYQLCASHFITIVCAGLWGALLALLLVQLLPRLLPGVRTEEAYLLAYGLTLGSFVFPYSGAAFVHNFETFWVVATFYLLVNGLGHASPRRSSIALGLAVGIMVLANPITALLVPVAYVCYWQQHKSLTSTFVSAAVSAAAIVPLLV